MWRHVQAALGSLPRWLLPIRIVDRYIATGFIFSYVVCAFSFVSLYMVVEAFSRLDRFLKSDLPLWKVVIHYFLVMTPVVYTHYLGPILTLCAGMFTMTLLNRSNELTPLKAAGVSIYRTAMPVFAGGLVLAGLTVFLQESLLPSIKDQIRFAHALGNKRQWISTEIFYDQEEGWTIHLNQYYPASMEGFGFQAVREDPANPRIKTILTAERIYRSRRDDSWYLSKVHRQVFDGARNIESRKPEEDLPFKTGMRPKDLEASDKDIPYLSSADLKELSRRRPSEHHLKVKIHHRWSLPITHLILLLLGLPFVFNTSNRNVFLTLLISIGICGAFFFFSTLSIQLGNNGTLHPALAAWLPTLFFGALGVTLFENIKT